jgi:hypothetical protein
MFKINLSFFFFKRHENQFDLLNNTCSLGDLREKKKTPKTYNELTFSHSLFFFPLFIDCIFISLENKHQYLITVSRFFFFSSVCSKRFISEFTLLFFYYIWSVMRKYIIISFMIISSLETSSKRSASKAFNNEVMKTTSSSMKKQRCKFSSPFFFPFPRLISIS